jgi:hypothetical protein
MYTRTVSQFRRPAPSAEAAGIAPASLAPHVIARNSTTDHGASTASALKTARYPSTSIPRQSFKAEKLTSVDFSRPPSDQGIITSD